MMNYIEYEDGETGSCFEIVYNVNNSGNVEITNVYLNDKDVLPLLSEEVLLSMQLYVDDYISFMEII